LKPIFQPCNERPQHISLRRSEVYCISADRTAHSLIDYWHDTVVCLSVCLSGCDSVCSGAQGRRRSQKLCRRFLWGHFLFTYSDTFGSSRCVVHVVT